MLAIKSNLNSLSLIFMLLILHYSLYACDSSSGSGSDVPPRFEDLTAPIIIPASIQPAPISVNQNAIAYDTKFSIPFSEPLERTDSATNSGSVIMTQTGLQQKLLINYYLQKSTSTDRNSILVIEPINNLEFGRKYTIIISGFRDLALNEMLEQRINYTVHVDSDKDGMPDWWETKYGGDLFQANGDYDNDQLADLWEFTYKSNPTIADSDYDGSGDNSEVLSNRNPVISEAAITTLLMRKRNSSKVSNPE